MDTSEDEYTVDEEGYRYKTVTVNCSRCGKEFKFTAKYKSGWCPDCKRMIWNERHSEEYEAYKERYDLPDEEDVLTQDRIQELEAMPYKEYLLTPEWTRIRKFIYWRAGGRCQVCNKKGILHVHHRTYELRGTESPYNLIAVCPTCHSKFHGIGEGES